MPIYEYRCESCEHELEAIQKIADPPLIDCPDCGEPALKKLISAPAFRLKGSGWYETDFKSKDKQRNVIKTEDKPAEAGTKKETKKETKPETKSETNTPSKPGKGDAPPASAA